MTAEAAFRSLLATAGIQVNGADPWDIQVHDDRLFRRVFAEGTLGLGEAYMDGWWDCDQLDEFFHRALRADLGDKLRASPAAAWLIVSSRLFNLQSKRRAGMAADTHYDLGIDIFEATFDRRLTGSCGYWESATTLDAAQEAKLDLVCRKLGLKAGQRVLDIGCGWGAFLGFAAERYGARGVGVTISREQVAYASKRYAGRPIEFRLQDYRNYDGPVDHVASMGMFEHVGRKNYRRFFEVAHRALRRDGLLLLHTIWTDARRPAIEPWLNKYIFPNGVLPTVGDVGRAVEGLFTVEDVENFGVYYDRTLMAWRDKFQSNREAISRKYGERFCRMWTYYLCSCAGGFRSRIISVGQFVLSPRGVPGGWFRPARAREPAATSLGAGRIRIPALPCDSQAIASG
ncbi:MAG TPA: cyclopropane fatty acyl phospholipid synthase [Caulobacteraceae bacterium]|jgi:cyclopropane-fatty-acyl-phospholipid synthase